MSYSRAMSAATSKSYDLAFVLADKRFFWKNPNHGVTLTDAGKQSCLSWENEGRTECALWTDIVSVAMSSATAGKGAVNQCRIQFRDGRALTVTTGDASGLPDPDKKPLYRDFIRDLHQRLAVAPAGTIAFRAGFSEGRYKALIVISIIAGLFFVGTPLVLVFIVRDWKVLGVLAAGALFVWPLWNVLENNRPRDYDPRYPPPELTA